ncbi:hypothetical protein TBLA_0E04250 [Henningerozyma blattae CBS 6284]|uniref:Checkpoint protein RAD24-like helical bundle domain-containing protein n=1 Tax=Henningerozyma blattae (strain ATCC 34711 / CBS 6284 / DSM 70876 / NBRC 10599 / NRRL Y-10934 / UCD 77-7) TaxID=1071380 RepID=I2H527_HENB6|nr:hypothetical protein TBLA_0E04250 [Tetrapisispora blattae CBS 6284]CCH61479.1 hypothetical protein TBLA_0E04250 [Tetrapisispora blattae CBS 6284]
MGIKNQEFSSLSNPPVIQRNLSSLSSHINKWNTSRPTSPLKKEVKLTRKISKPKARRISINDEQASCSNNNSPFNERNENDMWFNIFKPSTLEDVCIHKKKANDIITALKGIMSGKEDIRILLLTGPSGCSKSTFIKEASKILIPQYRAHGITSLFSEESGEHLPSTYIEYSNDAVLNGISSIDSFYEFLKESKYRVGSNLSIILVEDFPNLFHITTRQNFQKVILEWLYSSELILPPLVICLTECEIEDTENNFRHSFGIETSWTAPTVLGNEILNHPKLKQIKCNPINMTLTKKQLNFLCNENKTLIMANNKWQQKDIIIKDISQSTGDIRSGIAALQFWATSSSDLPIITRKSPVSFFHAVGRIIHGSKNLTDDNEMINELDAESETLISSSTFKLGLLENYPHFNKSDFSIKTAYDVLDALSVGDCIKDDDKESLNYTLRKIRYSMNKQKINSNQHGKTSFPKEWKIRQLQNEMAVESSDLLNVSFFKYGQVRQTSDIYLDYAYYSPYICKLRQYKKKSLEYYLNTLPNNSPIRLETMRKNKDNLIVDDSIDIVERLGKEIKPLHLDSAEIEIDNSDINLKQQRPIDILRRKRDTKLQALRSMYEKNYSQEYEEIIPEEESYFENDPIVDPDDSSSNEDGLDNGFPESDDEDDDALYEYLSQRKPQNSQSQQQSIPTPSNNISFNESLSDSDLEGL